MKTLLILAALALPAFAQTAVTCTTATVPVCGQAAGINFVQIKPKAMPFSAASTVTTLDAFLRVLTVTNTTAGALTVTVLDGQATPVALLQGYSIAANSEQTFQFDTPYYLPGGFNVQASATGLNYFCAWSH
jgi:hypothetical protein